MNKILAGYLVIIYQYASENYDVSFFLIVSRKFKHGIAWDMAQYAPSGRAANYAAMFKTFMRSVKKFNRYAHCRELVCVDYNFINWYRTQVKSMNVNIHCIHNYADVPDVLRERESDKLSIVFARRLVQYRGTRLFADTIAETLSRHPEISITVAGKGSDEEYMRGKLSAFPQVNFTSYSSQDSVNFHSNYDIAVVPTINHEGTSLALLEAMSAGCAVIASNVGGMSNIIIDGYNGLLINPVQAELSEALDRLINDNALRKYLAGKAHETVKAGFSFDIWQGKWLKLIASLKC